MYVWHICLHFRQHVDQRQRYEVNYFVTSFYALRAVVQSSQAQSFVKFSPNTSPHAWQSLGRTLIQRPTKTSLTGCWKPPDQHVHVMRCGGTSSSLLLVMHLATGSFLFLVAMHRASARTVFSTTATPSKWATSTWSGVERTGVAFVGDLLVRAFDAGGLGEDHLDVLLLKPIRALDTRRWAEVQKERSNSDFKSKNI